MRSALRKYPFSALFFLLLIRVALAGTGTTRVQVCPVCGTEVEATVLFSSNTFGGADPDFMERCAGAYPLIVSPVMCPKCHYSVYSAESYEDGVAPELKRALLEEPSRFEVPEHHPIQHNGPLRGSFTEGLDAKGSFPAWVRYDLMGQQSEFLKEPPAKLMRLEQMAAWSVRLEENPFAEYLADLSPEQRDTVFNSLESKPENENHALAQIEVGRLLLKEEKLTREGAIVAGYLLRSHGELADLENALPRLDTVIGEPELTAEVTRSIALERRYLERALSYADPVIAAPSEKTDPSVIYYLKGELLRRLGRPAEAFSSYQQAGQGDMPDWLGDWVKTQQALVAPDS